MESRNQRIIGKLEGFGWKARIVSISHVQEIRSELAQLRKDHLDVEKSVGRYIDKFNFGESMDAPKDGSLLIIAIAQPMARAWFTLKGVQKPAILPPTYLMNTCVENEAIHPRIREVNQKLNQVLAGEGVNGTKINLPGKLMAVKSGLGKYGRNNICYVDDSSFYWIGVYATDLPCEEDQWGEETVMEACEGCGCCAAACPGSAIADDRFLVHVDRCLTLYNESSLPFPDWIGSDWHNTAIGCMECQWHCPVNRSSLTMIEDIASFDETETESILSGMAFSDLSNETQQKLNNWNYAEDYELLARNLTALFFDDVVTCAEMKKIEERAAASGISYEQMMENAGQAAATAILERESVDGETVLILCGKGNNGGDGFVVARKLNEAGAEVIILLPDGDPTSAESKRNKELCENLGIRLARSLEEAMAHWNDGALKLIVDGLYGTGFHGQMAPSIRIITQWINNADATIYALDIPSGLTGDDAIAAEDAIFADTTIVFHRRKPVHCSDALKTNLGELCLVGIGIEDNLEWKK